MRAARLIALPTLAIALVVSAAAHAGDPRRTLIGSVDPAGTVELRITPGKLVEPTPGKIRIRLYRFAFAGLPLTCDDGTARTYDLHGSTIVPKDRGLQSLIGGGYDQLDAAGNRESWSVFGVLQRANYAVGIVKAKTVDTSGPRRVTCATERLAWTAGKVAPAN